MTTDTTATLRIVEVDKLCKSRVGLTAAYKAGFELQEKGWMRYPAASWERPAILIFDGAECVAGVNYSVNEDHCSVSIDFAFCTTPKALALALLRFRRLIKALPCEELEFACHPGNEQMMKAVRMLGLQPKTLSFSVPLQPQRVTSHAD